MIGDIVLSAASQQYGGFTVPSVDEILEPYAEKSHKKLIEKYRGLGLDEETVQKVAWADLEKEMEQGFQGWEYKFNSVSSSRGDYPFITVTAGTNTSKYGKLATIKMLQVRQEGQGKEGHKKPVLFPKLVFYMMRIFMDRGNRWKMCLKRESNAPENNVSGLAESDRKRVCCKYVQAIRKDYQPDGMPCIPFTMV